MQNFELNFERAAAAIFRLHAHNTQQWRHVNCYSLFRGCNNDVIVSSFGSMLEAHVEGREIVLTQSFDFFFDILNFIRSFLRVYITFWIFSTISYFRKIIIIEKQIVYNRKNWFGLPESSAKYVIFIWLSLCDYWAVDNKFKE